MPAAAPETVAATIETPPLPSAWIPFLELFVSSEPLELSTKPVAPMLIAPLPELLAYIPPATAPALTVSAPLPIA